MVNPAIVHGVFKTKQINKPAGVHNETKKNKNLYHLDLTIVVLKFLKDFYSSTCHHEGN